MQASTDLYKSVTTYSIHEGWEQAVAQIKQDPEMRAMILRSVMSSMAFAGFSVDREQSERLFEQALNGPPLEYPGE